MKRGRCLRPFWTPLRTGKSRQPDIPSLVPQTRKVGSQRSQAMDSNVKSTREKNTSKDPERGRLCGRQDLAHTCICVWLFSFLLKCSSMNFMVLSWTGGFSCLTVRFTFLTSPKESQLPWALSAVNKVNVLDFLGPIWAIRAWALGLDRYMYFVVCTLLSDCYLRQNEGGTILLRKIDDFE